MTLIKAPLARSEWAHHWDLSVDYDATMELLKINIQELGVNAETNATCAKELTYHAILLTQISNESRISEAQEAVVRWGVQGFREIRVRTRKRSDNEERLIIIPEVLTDDQRKFIVRFKDTLSRIVIKDGKEALDTGAVKMYARRALGINTHSLRYSGITDLSIRKNVNPLVIGKITKHKNLSQLLTYLQEKQAIEELRKQVSAVT